jgi:photosystem II stability/assembly factor-like uncharacterized protein
MLAMVMVPSASAEESPTTVYLATDRGIFKSVDAGDSWAVVRDSYPAEQARVVAANPTVPDIVYAGGLDGLLRSLDGGQSWRPVIAITGSVRAVVFSYASPSSIYVVADQFWRSRDGGDSWDVFACDLPDSPVSIAVDHANEDRLFLLTRAALFRTEDGGATFVRLRPRILYPLVALSVVTGALGTRRVYLAYEGGIEFSPDNGNTWTVMDLRSPSGSGEINGKPMFEMVFRGARAIAADVRNPARLLACGITALMAWDGYELVSGPGVYESTTIGDRLFGMYDYDRFLRPGPDPECFFTALDSSPSGGAWIGTVRGLLYAPPGPWPYWRELSEFRDIAVYAATFANRE